MTDHNTMTAHQPLSNIAKAATQIAQKVHYVCGQDATDIDSIMFQVGAYLNDTRPHRELVEIFPSSTRDIVHLVLTASALLKHPPISIMAELSAELLDMEEANQSAVAAMLEGGAE